MSSSESHEWQAAYMSAVLETDPDKVLTRIVEAQQAIERRLLKNPSPDALEQQGINAAWTVLVALKNERASVKGTCIDRPNQPATAMSAMKMRAALSDGESAKKTP